MDNEQLGLYENNSRNYVDPNRQVQETDEFINNLRDIQNQNNTQITDQVRNLGADLVGSGGVWRSRYQTPQVNSMINNLRATTQAAALSQQLQNELNQKQREYKLAYRAAYNRAKAASNTGNNNNNNNNNNNGDVDVKTNEGNVGGKTIGAVGKTIIGDGYGNTWAEDNTTGEKGWESSNPMRSDSNWVNVFEWPFKYF